LRSHTSASHGERERDGRRRLWRGLEQLDVVTDDVALTAHAFDLDRYQLSQLDELLPQCVPARELREPGIRFAGARFSKMPSPCPLAATSPCAR
jgi:hypothetical protein